MTSSIPAWQPFELYGGWVPPVLDLDSGHEPVEGRVVVISATRTVRDRGWAPRAVVEMARGWASQGARVFLADLSLEDPEIHSVLEAGNLEGVSDSLLYGASIQRVARPADDGAFFVATAGTAVADPSLVLDHPRWTGMTHGFMTAGVTLVLYLPLGMPGSGSMLARGTHRILLARPGEVLDELDEGSDDRIIAVLGPDGTMGEFMDPPLGHAPPIPVGGQDFDDPLARDPLSAGSYGRPQRTSADLTTAPTRSRDPEPVPAPLEPVRAVSRRSRSGLISLVLVFAAALLFAALVALGLIDLSFLSAATEGEATQSELVLQPATRGVADVDGGGTGGTTPEVTTQDEGTTSVAAGEVVTLVTDVDGGPDEPVGRRAAADATRAGASAGASSEPVTARPTTALPTGAEAESSLGSPSADLRLVERFTYSLSLSAWETLPAAMEHARDWQRRRPDRHFVVAPIMSGAGLYFRVLAGPASDTQDAARLRSDLGRTVGETEEAGWILRRTPLAYLLEQTPNRNTAVAMVGQMETSGVPAYVLEAPDGSGFRVYAGAYRNAEDAQALADMLRERGMTPPPLTERIGRLPE